jgi:tetratricopeptide (TPR) repeat protein
VNISVFLKKTIVFLLLIPFIPLYIACNASGTYSSVGDSNQNNSIIINRYYISGSDKHKENLQNLFNLLEKEPNAGEQQFAIVREIANEYIRLDEYGKLSNFLSAWVDQHPNDSYNAFYLLMIGYAYLEQEAAPTAALYFELIIKNYPDLTIQNESIHLICLNQLIELVDRPEQLVWYYEELISRFSDKIDLGIAYFMQGQAYEQIGDWDAAIQAYDQFLPYYNALIPGFPDAQNYAKQLVDFNKSAKDWTFDSLNSLVSSVKSALDAGSSSRLDRYRASVNFFARSWEQDYAENSGMSEFNLYDFMRTNRIRYAEEIDINSNANEAYLRTWGWDRISIWYLYFRKIYFPADPEIHARWEWAGIYYGEKF